LSHFLQGPKIATTKANQPPAVGVAGGDVSLSGRRFGEVLVEEGIITAEQLEAALRLQAVSRTYVPIGQVLLANKLVTRRQLDALLHRHKKRSRLGDILVKAGRITTAQLHEALAYQRRTPMPIGQALIQLRHISETTMREALCTQLHINFFDVDPIWIERALARLISERFAMRHLLVPLFRVDDVLVVAMDDPSQAEVIERLQTSLQLHIETVTTLIRKLKGAIARLYGPPMPPDVDAFRVRNILIGPIRDQLVVELVGKGLRGVSVVPPGWQ